MADTQTPLHQDADFMGATPADQARYLSATDPDFAAAHPDDQAAYLAHVTNASVAPGQGRVNDKPVEQPGFFKRAAESVGVPSSMEELKTAGEESRPKTMWGAVGQAAENLAPGVAQAGHMLWDEGKNIVQGTKEAAQEGAEAGQNIAEGEPILPNIGKAASGAVRGTMQATPFVGPAINTMGEDIHAGNLAGAAGGMTGIVGQLAVPEAIEHMTPKMIPAREPGLLGHEVPRAKAAVPEALPNPKPRIEYATPTPAGEPGLQGHEAPPATEPMPMAKANAKPRIEYAEPTPYAPPKAAPVKAEGLVGNEHIEPVADKEITPEEVKSTPGTSMSPEAEWRKRSQEIEGTIAKPAEIPTVEAVETPKPEAVAEKGTTVPEKETHGEQEGLRVSEEGRTASEATPEAAKANEGAKDNEGAASEQDKTNSKNIIKDLRDQNLIKAGKQHELDHEGYDFSKRSAPTETSTGRARVDRERFANDLTEKLTPEMAQKLAKATEAYDAEADPMFTDAERNNNSRAQRAQAIWDRAHEPDFGAEPEQGVKNAHKSTDEGNRADFEHEITNSVKMGPTPLKELRSFVGEHTDKPIKFLSAGGENSVYDLGNNKVLKVGKGTEVPKVPDLPEVLQPLAQRVIPAASGEFHASIFPKLETENIPYDEVKKMNDKLDAKGWTWDYDAKNLGKVPDDGYKIIDAGAMKKSKQ